MRAPNFWADRGFLSTLLLPAAGVYGLAVRARQRRTRPQRAGVPVICIGNLVAGGAGKTPVAMEIGKWLVARGRKVFFLSRGYGGQLQGPLLVDSGTHSSHDIGDEALLLAAVLPTVVARDRPAGARLAVEKGAEVVVMDDGFQNPSLHKDLSLLVVDGRYGFGNGRLIPAGPLREPVEAGLKRAQAVIVMNPSGQTLPMSLPPEVALLKAHLLPGGEGAALEGRKVVAFAGIGRPEKFYATLRQLGAGIQEMISFPDHHVFQPRDLERLKQSASARQAILVTTAKDYVRLPEEFKPRVRTVDIRVVFEDETALQRLLSQVLSA